MTDVASGLVAGELVATRYVLLDELARGGMSTVYRARDRLTGHVVTLKRIHGDGRRAGSEASGDAGEARRNGSDGPSVGTADRLELAHEFGLLASLRHPNIIAVRDYGFDENGQSFLTMDLEEGAHTLLEAGHGKPLDVQVDLLVQTLRAMAYVHRRGIVHRDIKPSNVLVLDGRVKLVDFGLSFLRVAPETPEGTAAGTIAYLAPEIVHGAMPSVASDLFAFGIVMYEMMAGRHPFLLDDEVGFWRRLSTKPPPLPAAGIDPRLDVVLHRLLAKQPADRFGDANEVIAAMSAALGWELVAETIEARESFLQAAEFVGRERETAILDGALTDAISGRGACWLVGGESGVGKSRLLSELRSLALVRGVAIARGQASAEGAEPYAIWRDVVRGLILAAQGVGVRLASDLRPLVPDIEELLGLAIEARELDSEGAQLRLMDAVEEMLDLLPRPVAILLEDLQWADSASMRLLARLVRTIAGRRLVVVGSYRDDEVSDVLAAVPGANAMKLARLDARGTEALAASMIGTPAHEPGLVQFLLRQTEGIPFFLVELVRSMAEEAGSLPGIVARASMSVGTSEGTRRLLRRRLSRVPSEARGALETAAVIGREVDAPLLAALVRGLDFHTWSSLCVAGGVFSADEDRIRFAHDKLREHIVEELGDDRRRELHREIAEAVERMAPVPERYLPALAHHWGGAGDRSKEADACERAGEQALRSGACTEAARFYERALEIVGPAASARRTSAGTRRNFARLMNPNLGVDPRVDAFRAARLEAGITESRFRLGDFAECRLHAQRAMKLCGVEMPSTETGIRVDVLRQVVRRTFQALVRFRSRDADSAEVAREMVRVQAYLYEVCFFALEPIGLVWSVLSMANHCSPLGPSPALARAHMALALVSGASGLHTLARRWCRSSIAIARAVCSKSELGYLLNRVNNYRFACCDWQTADREIAMAAELGEQSGDRRVWEEARSMQGMSGLFQGRYEDGIRAWSDAFASSEHRGDLQIECWSLMGQGDNLVRLGRDEEAVAFYQRAIERSAGRAHATERIWGHGMLALASLRSGDDAAAEKHARESLELLSSARPMAYWTQFGTAATFEVFLSLAERAGDDAIGRNAAMGRAARARTAMRDFARAFPMGKPFYLLLDGRYQWLRGRRRRALRLWNQCASLSETLGTPFELGSACLELAGRLDEGDPSRRRHLDKARTTFERCRAARELAAVDLLEVATGGLRHIQGVIP